MCVKILPDNTERCLGEDEISLRRLLELLKEDIEGYNVMILVNDRLAENLDSTVSSRDRVIVVKENIGG